MIEEHFVNFENSFEYNSGKKDEKSKQKINNKKKKTLSRFLQSLFTYLKVNIHRLKNEVSMNLYVEEFVERMKISFEIDEQNTGENDDRHLSN